MLEDKKYLAKNPLELWKSEEVKNLLADFYEANFVEAGLKKGLGEELINKIWRDKDATDPEALRQECDAILLQAKAEIKNHPDESEPLDIINFDGVKKFLDLGANKLATINYYAQKYEGVEQFVGVDIIPQHNVFVRPEKCAYFQIDSEMKSFPVEEQSVDLANIQFVFHHFSDLASIRKTLEVCRKIIKPQGRLVLWEESFTNKLDSSLTESNAANLGIKTDKKFTERFYLLSEEKRWEFIVVNDWLINVNNPHMPWTGQYYAWSEWVSLLGEYGFEMEKEYNFGLRVNGRLKQGVHMLGIFQKSI